MSEKSGYRKISDYGIIGNLRTVALVALDGSIDWLCFPDLDSPSIFGALLDSRKGGRFALSPAGEFDSTAEYVEKTNILRTRFRTRHGTAELTDFMPVPPACRHGREGRCHELRRRLKVTSGTVELRLVFDPRFDYAREEPEITREGRMLRARGKSGMATLAVSGDLPLSGDSRIAAWTLREGEDLWCLLKYGVDEAFACDREVSERSLETTESFWRNWLKRRETGRSINLGHYQPMVDRSALVLKLLQFEETGPLAAAATTSLPEEIGGVRNWDYRYSWVRDTSFTLQALFNLGHLSETEGYLQWVEKLLSEQGAGELQIMYGLRGERDLPEIELNHLDGYKGSRPVRIGNGAAGQKQLDIYGELMDAALRLSDYVGKIDYELWPVLRDICDHVVGHWRDLDSGIWEVRGGPFPFVYSKVMCWVALDRGVTIARRYGFPAAVETWERTRDEIHAEVLDRGWSAKKESFVQHYDTEALDSSNLLIPILGFLPFSDRRVAATVAAVEKELSHEGFLYRYVSEDGLQGGEGTFLLCSFWLVDCLTGLGRVAEADTLLRQLESTANHLGLFSEEYDVVWRESLGNFPQAFTHIGYINSVLGLAAARAGAGAEVPPPSRLPPLERFLGRDVVLNEVEYDGEGEGDNLAEKLKNAMNVLRGAFFDTARSRVAYEKMKGSEAYGDYLALSYRLREMDPLSLSSRNEKTAFWINLYNVIVIHAVIELGIRDSVKEVPNFFRRVGYRVGGFTLSPYDIEHGILRGNRRPPYRPFPIFGDNDPGLGLAVAEPDPRIHFALVCASSSCPPIDVYRAESLEEELDISGRTFLNTGGVVVDREAGTVSLSRIFKWYGRDFGSSQAERIAFIAPYLYREEEGAYLLENRDSVQIVYQDYDWRLNRG